MRPPARTLPASHPQAPTGLEPRRARRAAGGPAPRRDSGAVAAGAGGRRAGRDGARPGAGGCCIDNRECSALRLIQLVYASKPFGFDTATLNAILSDARRLNPANAITGALICREDLYLQLLEGPEPAVEAPTSASPRTTATSGSSASSPAPSPSTSAPTGRCATTRRAPGCGRGRRWRTAPSAGRSRRRSWRCSSGWLKSPNRAAVWGPSEPAHVHVFGDGHARIDLLGPDGLPQLIWAEGMTRSEVRRAMAVVTAELQPLLERWREIHGGAV